MRQKKKMGVANITFDLYKLNPKDFIGCLNIKATFYEIYSVSYDIKCMGAKSVLRWVHFHYWSGICVNVKSVFAYWFCEAGVFINLVFLLILTYQPICWPFLCKDSWLVKTYYSFLWWNLKFPQGKILSACIYCKGVGRVSLFSWENFPRFLWLVWRMQEAEEEALDSLKGELQGDEMRGIWDLMAEVLKLAQTLQYLAAKFTTWAYMEAKENGRDMTLSTVIMWICHLY